MENFLRSWYKKDCSRLPREEFKECQTNTALAEKIWSEIGEVKKEADNCEKFLNREGTWETRVESYKSCVGRVNTKYEAIAKNYESVKQN